MQLNEGVDHAERAAANEAVFRQINERLEVLAAAFEGVVSTGVFVCECAAIDCVEQLELSLEEYEDVRSDPNQFVVVRRHVVAEVETVTRESERYAVVAKLGAGAAVAAATDPRS